MQNYDEFQINKEEIAKIIIQKRKEFNLTQQDLANKLYVSDRAVSKWERAISIPDIDTLVKLSKIFNITTDELIQGCIKNENEDVYINNKKFIIVSLILLIIAFIIYNIITIQINYSIEYIFIAYLILFLGFIIFIRNNNNKKNNKKIILVFTLFYTVMLLTNTFYTGISYKANNNISDGFKMNLIPLFPIIEDIMLVINKIQPISLLFNYVIIDLCLFAPYSFLIPHIKEELPEKKLVCIILLVIFIKELIQLMTGYGIFDINDIILNFLGFYLTSKILKKLSLI